VKRRKEDVSISSERIERDMFMEEYMGMGDYNLDNYDMDEYAYREKFVDYDFF